MTRKDYIAIANAIANQRLFLHSDKNVQDTIDEIAGAIAHVMAADNPNFDVSKFLTACGV